MAMRYKADAEAFRGIPLSPLGNQRSYDGTERCADRRADKAAQSRCDSTGETSVATFYWSEWSEALHGPELLPFPIISATQG